jgi:hypothetical protein
MTENYHGRQPTSALKNTRSTVDHEIRQNKCRYCNCASFGIDADSIKTPDGQFSVRGNILLVGRL